MLNPYAAYKQQSVMTMTTGDILKMLYDELLKRISLSIEAIKAKDIEAANQNLKKAQEITNHLLGSLDMKYEVSNNLSALYSYFYQTLVQANIKKSVGELEELIPLITSLRDAYIQADKAVRAASATPK